MGTVIPTARARLATAASAIVLLAALTGCDGSDKKQSSADHYNKAVEYRTKGDSAAALIEIKNALQADAKNGPAHLLRAEVLIDSGDIASAEDELRAAATAGVPASDWFGPLGRSLLMQQNFVKLRDLVGQNANGEPSVQAKGKALLGDISLAEGNLAGARKSFEASLAQNDKDLDGLLGMVQVELRAGEPGKAADLLSRARAVAPREPEVDKAEASLDAVRGNQDAAEAVLRQAVDRKPDNPFYRLALAQVLVGNRKNEEADKQLSIVLKRLPNHPLAKHLRALILYQAGKFKEADEFETAVLSKAPNLQAAQYVDGLAKYTLGQYAQAEHLLNGIKAGDPMGDEANFVRGAALLQLGRRQESYQVLQPLEQGMAGNPRYLELVATAAGANNDLPRSRDLYQKALAVDPGNPAILTRLASVKLALGDRAGGTANLREAIEAAPDDDRAQGILFESLLKNKEFDQAQASAKKVQTAHPTEARGWVMAGMAYALAGKQNEAIEEFQQALRRDPAASDAVTDLAGIYLAQGRIDLARSTVEEAYKHDPKNASICAMGSKVEDTAKNPAGMQAWLERDLEIEPKSASARVVLVGVLIQTGQPQKAVSVGLTGLQLMPGDPTILKALGQAYLAAKQPGNAATTLRDLVAAQPEGDNYYLLARAYLDLHDEPRLRDTLDQLVQKAPDYRPGRVLLARTLLDQKETIGRAETMIAALAAERPEDPDVIELQARAASATSGPKAAIEILQNHLAAQKSRPRTLVLLLASAEWDARQQDKAIQALADWAADHPDDAATRMTLATRQIQSKRYDDAHKTLDEEIRINPADWVAQNNLAWVLMTQGDLNAAQQQIDGAHRLAGAQQEVLDTEGQIALARGDAPHAIDLLRLAASTGKTAPGTQIHLARALLAAGKATDAQDTLKAAIANARPGPEADEAKALLATIKN
jgi:putative PEP-CTERM system TPR-repeat lipoprotein